MIEIRVQVLLTIASAVLMSACGSVQTMEAPAAVSETAAVSAGVQEDVAEDVEEKSAISEGKEEKQEEKKEAAVAETAEKEAEAVIGTRTEDGKPVAFANESGKTITAIAVKVKDEEKFGDNLLPEEMKAEETRDFYFEAEEGTIYLVQFVFEDQSEFETEFPFATEDTVRLKVDGESYYLEYTENGNLVSTLDIQVNGAEAEETSDTGNERFNESDNTKPGAAEIADDPNAGCLGDGSMTWGDDAGDPNAGCLGDDNMTWGDDAGDPNAGCLGDDSMTW